jgi:signal transduction histidine kinase/ActR/RegA family two-component response regulator
MAIWRRILLGITDANDGPTGESARFLSLIEVRTAMRICLLSTTAMIVLLLLEVHSGIIAPHDQIGLPAIAITMLALYFRLRRDPASLLSCQRIAVVMIMLYFGACGVSAILHRAGELSPYWTANNLQWLPVVTLLLHFSYPWGIAMRLSVLMLLIASLPAVWLGWVSKESPWQELTRSLLINTVLMQTTFAVCLLVITRFTSGVRDIVAGHSAGASDIRQALENWVSQRTAELAQARDAAESASQAKSRFLAVMSHELRTPLHAMLVAADLLNEIQPPAEQSDPRQRALLSTVQSSGQHLLALIDQVLEMSRIEAGKVEANEQALDLAALTQKVCTAVRARAELKGLKLMVSLPDDLPRMRLGDELRLSQVLINLLANSVKFTQAGHVSLTVRQLPDAPAGEDWLQWSVIDTGPGMNEREQGHVFEAFYQADNSPTRDPGGVGLGLTITRELVQLMRGQMSLRSQPGQGTRVDVALPMPILQDVIEMPTRVHRPLPSLQGRTALVVDDDLVNRMLAAEMLKAAGIEVIEAESGLQALQCLRHHLPDIVIMDWQMPGMDGLEATRLIRHGEAGDAVRDVPVLGLTANAFDEDRHTCLSAGMNNVLTKPVSRDVLLQEVAFWTVGNEPGQQVLQA